MITKIVFVYMSFSFCGMNCLNVLFFLVAYIYNYKCINFLYICICITFGQMYHVTCTMYQIYSICMHFGQMNNNNNDNDNNMTSYNII